MRPNLDPLLGPSCAVAMDPVLAFRKGSNFNGNKNDAKTLWKMSASGMPTNSGEM